MDDDRRLRSPPFGCCSSVRDRRLALWGRRVRTDRGGLPTPAWAAFAAQGPVPSPRQRPAAREHGRDARQSMARHCGTLLARPGQSRTSVAGGAGLGPEQPRGSSRQQKGAPRQALPEATAAGPASRRASAAGACCRDAVAGQPSSRRSSRTARRRRCCAASSWLQPPSGPREDATSSTTSPAASSRSPMRSWWPTMAAPSAPLFVQLPQVRSSPAGERACRPAASR